MRHATVCKFTVSTLGYVYPNAKAKLYTILQTSLHILLELADSAVLPYNLERFPKSMKDTMETFENNNVTKKLEDNKASLKFVYEAIEEFELSTTKFMAKLEIVKA